MRVRVGIVALLLCAWLAPPAAPVSLVSPVGADAIPVVTRHNDNGHTGADLQETTLTDANVGTATFGELFSRVLDGNTFAQPLYVPALTIGGRKHNVVFAATEHNSVYAYDADSNAGEPLWRTTLPDVPTPLPNPYCCGNGNYQTMTFTDIKVELGITSTPVIDLSTNTLYTVAFGQIARPGLSPVPDCSAGKQDVGCDYQYTLHALDLLTGGEKTSRVVQATYPGFANDQQSQGVILFQAGLQTQRPGLILANGSLYLCFGSFKDDNPYHGWMMRYDAATLTQQAVYNSTPNADQNGYSVGGGLWASGEGPTVDPDTGDLYIATGNGSYTINRPGGSGKDVSDSVLRLDKNTLQLKGYFTPFDVNSYGPPSGSPGSCTNTSGYNCYDLDFGSAGVLAIPGTHLLIATGKIGRFVVLDRSNPTALGGRGTNADNDNPDSGSLVLQSFKATRTQPNCLPPTQNDLYYRYYHEGCYGRMYATPVFWHGPNNDYVYLWPRYDSLKQIRYNGSAQPGQNFATEADPSPHDANDADRNIPEAVYAHERPYVFGMAGSEYNPVVGGGTLSLSANGATAGTGILWAAVPVAGGPGLDRERLTAYNAQDVTQQLWDSGDLGPLAKFVPPMIANGHVYFPTFYAPAPANQTDPLNTNRLHVFGLLNAAVSLVTSGFPTTVVPGQAKTITVTLRDKNGNPATAYRGTVQLTSSDSQAILPPAHTFTAADAGSFTFTVTLRTPGTQSITAADMNAGGLGATQTNITVSAALSLTGLSQTSGPSTGGNTVTLTGTGFIPGVAVAFGGTPATVTNVSGDGTALTVSLPAHASAVVDVSATLNGVTVTLPGIYTYVLPAPAATHAAVPTITVGPIAPQPAPTHVPVPTVLPATGTPLPQPVRH